MSNARTESAPSPPEATPAVVGVDGAKSGWIATWRINGRLGYLVHPTVLDLSRRYPCTRVIAVDMPIGLSDRGPRSPDREARRFVGARRACSVFSSPVRGILDAKTQPEASRRHREIDERGFGCQSFAILPKIREWDSVLRDDENFRARVFEVHPEVCFAALNGGAGLVDSKKRLVGRMRRIELLSSVFDGDQVRSLLDALPRSVAAADDLLDSLAALWTAERIALGNARSLPDPPMLDSVGLTMAIWY